MEDNYEEFYNEIKRLVRENGKSTHVRIQEIEELLVRFGV